MKLHYTLGLLLPLVTAKVSYDGYKAFSIETGDVHDALENILSDLDFVDLSCGGSNHKTLDVAIAPKSLEAFKALDLNATVISEDLGKDFAAEKMGSYERTFCPPPSSTELETNSPQLQ